MATDLERMVASVSADITKFERAMDKALAVTNQRTAQMESRFRKMNTNVSQIFSKMGAGGAGGILSAAALGLAARELIAYADTWTRVQNQLRVSGIEGSKVAGVLNQIFAVAQKHGTAIEPLVTLYSRAAQASGELKASQEQLLKFTDGVSAALRVAGTTSTQASGALLQLAQAIGTGVVRAEEFNSVNEGARPILQAVATGLKEAGGSVSKLRGLVIDGKLSSQAFFHAFLVGMPQIERQSEKAVGTIGQAVDRLTNAFTKFIGEADKLTGASGRFASALNWVSRELDRVLAGIKVLQNFSKAADALEVQAKSDIARVRAEGQIAYLMTQIESAESKLAAARARMQMDGAKAVQLQIDKLIADIASYKDALAKLQNALASAQLPVPTAQPGMDVPGSVDQGVSGTVLGPPVIDPVSIKDFPPPPGTKTTKEKLTEAQKAEAAIYKVITALEFEVDQIKRTEIEQEIYNNLKEAGAGRAGEYGQQIEALTRAKAALKKADEALIKSQEELNESFKAAGAAASDFFEGVIFDGKTMKESLHDVVEQMLRDLLRFSLAGGTFMGQSGNGLFAILGQAITGNPAVPGKAGGGSITAGKPYMVGERGPELIIPRSGGVVIPNHKLAARGGGGMTLNANVSIDITGANGEDAISRIAYQAAARGVDESVRRVRRNLPAMLRDSEMRGV